VMAHLVAFRTSEIGLRMALGASPASVMRMVLSHGRRLTLVGIAVGIAGALAVSRVDAAAALRSGSGGPACLRRAVAHLAARDGVRFVVPGPARHEDRSPDCATKRVSELSQLFEEP
jgi:hypothetical protein